MTLSRDASDAEVEEWALNLVLGDLRSGGEDVAFIRRVPPANHRTPDFEVRHCGEVVAVEVTQLWTSQQLMAIASRIQKGLRAELGQDVEQMAAGTFIVELHIGEAARSHGIPQVISEVAKFIRQRGPDMAKVVAAGVGDALGAGTGDGLPVADALLGDGVT